MSPGVFAEVVPTSAFIDVAIGANHKAESTKMVQNMNEQVTVTAVNIYPKGEVESARYSELMPSVIHFQQHVLSLVISSIFTNTPTNIRI